MRRLDTLRTELSQWADQSLMEDCVCILEFMDKLPDNQLEMLSLLMLSRAVGRESPDDRLVAAITHLVSSPLQALEAKGLFVDRDNEEFVVSAQELFNARLHGEFVHPETGELVPNFAEHIFPFFHASERYMRLKQNDRV